MTTDLKFKFGPFASTEGSVEALTEAGKTFLRATFDSYAIVGATMPKTRAHDLMMFATRKGLSVEWEA